jgi:hypothetical protein
MLSALLYLVFPYVAINLGAGKQLIAGYSYRSIFL